MTEGILTIEWYMARIKDAITRKIGVDKFIGSVTFEVNIKEGRITNINLVSKESIRKE